MFLLIVFSASAWAGGREPSSDRALAVFVDEMVARHGFTRNELDEAFGSARSVPQILELMDRASDPKPWDEYRSLFVTSEKIAEESASERERRRLDLARQRYGVPEEIVTAVIGIETTTEGIAGDSRFSRRSRPSRSSIHGARASFGWNWSTSCS
jgi:membrane-bound lytic murein transglycosylase B